LILSKYIIRDGLSQKTISRYCPFNSSLLDKKSAKPHISSREENQVFEKPSVGKKT
jgi:hypothetical protein